MDSIEALVANIIGLSEEDKITQLHRLLKQSEDLIQIMSPYLGQYLDQLDCQKHSLGYLFLLKAYLSTPAAKEQAELIPLVVRFIKSCVAEQIRLEPKKFTYVCKTLNCLVVQRQVPIMGIAPLQEAVRKLQTSSGRLTALHSEFLLVCLHAKCYRIGYSTLKEDIFEVDQPRDLFLYCYYGGMICIGQKQFRQAIQLLDIVVTAPTQSLNCIAMEAYKKYILVNLIQNGQFSATFPERASSVAQRSLQHFSQPYLDLATSYGTGKIAELENCVATHREKFESDINLELVNQVISSLYKRNIQRLSLQDIAVQPNTPKKAEMRVHQMIGDGEIFATINQKDGMVCISEESEQCKSYETTESIDSSIKRIMSLTKKLNSVHEVISCDPCRLLIAWGTTIFGIANKCGKFVAADSRSVGYDGKIDDFSLKIHEIATNLMAATAGCTAWSLPIVCDLQAQVGKGKNTTVEYCISYAKWFFSRKDYVADKNIFSQIPQNFDIQNEKCGILFVGFHEGKTQMCYISNDGNKKCVEVVEEPCYLKTGQRASFIGLGSGSDYLYEHISADEMDSIKNGKEDSEFYYKVMVKALRNSALRDPEYTGGFAKVFWITDSCIIEKKEALLSYPLDFKAWVKLIVDTETAAEGDLSKIEAVYDAFLTEFPMCCGYWMKYVHHEACLGTLDKVEEVYERAIKFVAYSVDIWLHYCKFAVLNHRCFEAVLKLAKLKSKSDVSEVGVSKYDANAVRRLFQRGLLHVGTNYVSFLLWNEYIKFEESLGERGHAAVIYKNLLAVPIKDRNSIFKRCSSDSCHNVLLKDSSLQKQSGIRLRKRKNLLKGSSSLKKLLGPLTSMCPTLMSRSLQLGESI
ncbi:uncharacterized protein LOC113280865 isoform X2 [Papaver somniferum]|uniref:uncharacterized protein LOC113280865 isoform X2 n=1 Tax=Papaver somniferum TaxID=3469 RepID=UPI000E6F7711|nr:uncharacterized protein LOC113280865 isoform X2 [Papaver somniferum]XP_026385226.1 uncharacterized protein LOC113280865 isoform X2 [Papaver somniferum]